MSKIYFLHGITGSKNNFIYLQKHFPGSESFDLIGFGSEKKPNAPYDKEFFVKFLETKITEQAILVGHSMGSILAKEFALAHPAMVERLFLISYPLQSEGRLLYEMSDPYTKALLGASRRSKIVTYLDQSMKVLSIPGSYFFYRKYWLTVRDYYRRTAISLARSAQNTIFVDDYKTLYQLKDKAILIVGENDRNVNKALLPDFDYHIIKNMRHYFFGYEDEIASFIQSRLKGD